MANEPLVPKPFNVVQYIIWAVEAWPDAISIPEEMLAEPTQNRLTVDGDLVTFSYDNGDATYRLRRDLPREARGVVAEKVSGDPPSTLKRAAAKYQRKEAV